MIGHREWAGVALCAALAVSAGPAAAAIPTSFALFNATAALRATSRTSATHGAVTRASARRVAARMAASSVAATNHTAITRHARRHHRHTTAVLAANALPISRGAPERPAPSRERPRRATLPVITQLVRHAPASRYGPRHSFAAVTRCASWTLAARSLEARRELMPDPRILTVSGGRGPPRGSPSGPSRSRASLAPASADDSDASPIASLVSPQPQPLPPLGNDCPAPVRSAAVFPFTHVSEVGSRRLHADRLEGAMACFVLPSNGGTSCPASSPSPR